MHTPRLAHFVFPPTPLQGATPAARQNRFRGVSRIGLLAALVCAAALSGCAVAGAAISVTSTAVSVGAGAVGLAADAAIGTARITGKAVGAAADAVLPGDSD
ncbi:hypothetical protein QTH97_15905 [Variovorax sp. J22R24]|uniref:hypothetical protein n=1 Tax=Variovorax gracilis TaxID=3053502 RepID=UPI002576A1E1|nr:hypothetical protein [Variovorax sp. J22R24]MDM0106431.1 hypothetical protein [Variovorax sp. J22R24]